MRVTDAMMKAAVDDFPSGVLGGAHAHLRSALEAAFAVESSTHALREEGGRALYDAVVEIYSPLWEAIANAGEARPYWEALSDKTRREYCRRAELIKRAALASTSAEPPEWVGGAVPGEVALEESLHPRHQKAKAEPPVGDAALRKAAMEMVELSKPRDAAESVWFDCFTRRVNLIRNALSARPTSGDAALRVMLELIRNCAALADENFPSAGAALDAIHEIACKALADAPSNASPKQGDDDE